MITAIIMKITLIIIGNGAGNGIKLTSQNNKPKIISETTSVIINIFNELINN